MEVNTQTLQPRVREISLSMLSRTILSRMSYLRPGIHRKSQVPESPRKGVAQKKRNIDFQVGLCPRACIVLPALLFALE